jgi:hypothetical protein
VRGRNGTFVIHLLPFQCANTSSRADGRAAAPYPKEGISAA